MFVFLIFLACGGPLSGTYNFTTTDTQTDCPDSYVAEGSPEGRQTIEIDNDAGIAILTGDTAEVCDLNGMDISCDFAQADDQIDFNDQGLDAIYSVDIQMEGSWSTPDALAGEMNLAATCEGGDCEALAAQGAPACLIIWSFEAELL